MGIFRTTVDLSFPYGSGGGTNTWHLRTVSDDGTATEVNTLMGVVRSFYDAMSPLLPNSMTISWDGYAQQVGVADPVAISGTAWTPVTGDDAAGIGAAQDMICVTWRTTLSTRSGRGRTFVGPVGYGTFQGDGTVETTDLATARSAAESLVAASAAASVAGAIVVYSPTLGVARDITGTLVNDRFAHLSSRRG